MRKYINKIREFAHTAKDRLKEYLESLPHKTKRNIVLTLFAVYSVIAILTVGKAIYDIGRDKGREDVQRVLHLMTHQDRRSVLLNGK